MKFVVEEASKSAYEITLFETARTQCLGALSQVSKRLRRMCIDAGLLRRFTPKSRNIRGFLDWKFVYAFMQNLFRPPLMSLGIDIGDRKTWDLCAEIMWLNPQLSELCLTGCVGKMHKKFLSSNLATAIGKFGGSTLIFRNLRITKTSVDVLLKISGQNSVTNLFFDRSFLHFNAEHERLFPDPVPLFPNLKKVKYTGAFALRNKYTTAINFCRLFLCASGITHFEGAYGIERYCPLTAHGNVHLAEPIQANGIFRRIRHEFLLSLLRNSHRTLESYIDGNLLSGVHAGVYIGYTDIVSLSREPPFQNVKLLVLRTDDLESLLLHAPDYHICHSSQGPWTSLHHHSIWMDLSILYNRFIDCDLILIESKYCGITTEVNNWFWDLAYERIALGVRRTDGSASALRYVIIGNVSDGYCGMDLSSIFIDDVTTRMYGCLNSKQCRELIERRV